MAYLKLDKSLPLGPPLLAPLDNPDQETSIFRLAPWPFQKTFVTPKERLEEFIVHFVSASKLEVGVLSTDLVVFEPRNLLNLCRSASIPVEDPWDFNIQAVGQKSSVELLANALEDWIDFAFVPRPSVLAIYADHDEYTTFYSRDSVALESFASMLKVDGYKDVPDYVRGPASDGWR